MARKSLEEWFLQVSGETLVITSAHRSGRGGRRFWEPRADVFEDDQCIVVKVEVAGIAPSDLTVAYLPDHHSLYLRGVRFDDDPTDVVKRQIHQLEIFYGEFEREIQLPETPIEPEMIKAQFRSGFLYVLLRKSTFRVGHTRITIRKV